MTSEESGPPPKRLEMTIDDALEACIFYEDPRDLDYDTLDPLVQWLCEAINSSGWVWTAESCQGHPDARDPSFCWGTDPMLRLVTAWHHLGDMLDLLMRAASNRRKSAVRRARPRIPYNDGCPPVQYLDPVPLQIRPEKKGDIPEAWAEVLVYVEASTVWKRNLGIVVFDQFSRMLERSGKP